MFVGFICKAKRAFKDFMFHRMKLLYSRERTDFTELSGADTFTLTDVTWNSPCVNITNIHISLVRNYKKPYGLSLTPKVSFTPISLALHL